MNKKINLSNYLIVGPENTNNRPVEEIVKAAITAGFTCVQLRSKIASARELINLAEHCANIIAELKKSSEIALLIDDRLDVAIEARFKGIKVDGVHVGQDDISPEICRKYLGNEAIVGFTPRKINMIEYVKSNDFSFVDYFGVGPFHASISKPEAGQQNDGSVVTRSFEELKELMKITPVPVIVGGGVTVKDLPDLAKIGANGFFVISAVTNAENPYHAAKNLVDRWKKLVQSRSSIGTVSIPSA